MYFYPGEVVKAVTTAQRMIEGELYEVTDVKKQWTPAGTFVDYCIIAVDRKNPDPGLVGNLHLLAAKISTREE